jgi:hypothetical protein
MASKILTKLTMKEFIGKKSQLLAYALKGKPNDDAVTGAPVKLLRVIGQVTGFKADESDYGAYTQLNGIFTGTNMQTGEVVQVARCILPGAVGELLSSAIKNGAEAVDFAVEVYIEYDEAAATMYKFSTRSLIEPEQPKAIANIEAKMKALGIELDAPLMLAAPTLDKAAAKKQAEAEAAAEAAKKPVETTETTETAQATKPATASKKR